MKKKVKDSTLLAEEIRAAFSTVIYPDDDLIVQNDSGFHLECREINRVFKGKDWREITFATLEEYHAALFFFTKEGFRYYIPAFLISSLEHHNAASNVSNYTVYSFVPPVRDPKALEDFEAKMNQFNAAQRKVIIEFLEFMRDEHGKDFADKAPQQALKYWLKK